MTHRALSSKAFASRKSQLSSGFSLLELMVALTLGATVISSVYFIGGSSTKHFQEQQRIAQSQLSLRIAMEQLRRDISRAGFLGTPASSVDRNCETGTVDIRAVELTNNSEIAQIPNGVVHRVQADRLTLTGNYATSDNYLSAGIASTGNQIFLQREWQGFRRSFHQNTTGTPFDATLFENTFNSNRLLHVETLVGNHYFLQITSRNAATASIMFSPSVTIGGACLGGMGIGATVAPLSRIQYLIGNIGSNLNPGNTAAAAATGSQSIQLIRRELNFSGTPILNSERAVLDYVVDFNVDFIADTCDGNMVRLTDADAQTYTTSASVVGVRAAVVRLSVRTPQQDPRFPWVTRAVGAPLTRYRANASAPGASRVRTLEAEIVMPNIARLGCGSNSP